MASTCLLHGMKHWLAEIANAGRCGLHIYVDAKWRSGREDVMVRELSSVAGIANFGCKPPTEMSTPRSCRICPICCGRSMS